MNHEPRVSHIAYSGRVTNWVYLLPGAWTIGWFIILEGRYTSLAIISAVVCIGLPFLMFTSMRTIAGPKGVVVRYGFGLWRLRYPAAMIERADVIDPPTDPEVMRIWRQEYWRRHTIKSGPYLRLHLADGRRVVLTAPDPYSAAAVVNSYARNPPSDGGLEAPRQPRLRWWRAGHSRP